MNVKLRNEDRAPRSRMSGLSATSSSAVPASTTVSARNSTDQWSGSTPAFAPSTMRSG